MNNIKLKNWFLFIVLLFCSSTALVAQQTLLKNGYNKTNWCSSSGKGGGGGTHNMFVGIKGGLNIAKVVFSNELYNEIYLPSNMMLPFGGVFFEYDFDFNLAIAPSIQLKQDGSYVDGSYFDSDNNQRDINYSLLTRNIDFSIPVMYDFYITDKFAPYLLVAPYLSYNIGGLITLTDTKTDITGIKTITDYSTYVGKSNYRPMNYGVKLGAGVKYFANLSSIQLLFRLDAGYNLGLSNTFSEMELNGTADPLNLNLWEVSDTRRNRGIEVCLSIGIGI